MEQNTPISKAFKYCSMWWKPNKRNWSHVLICGASDNIHLVCSAFEPADSNGILHHHMFVSVQQLKKEKRYYPNW